MAGKLVGIDPDTKAITWAIWVNDGIRVGRVEASGRRAEDRFQTLIERFHSEMRDLAGATWVYLERPMVGPNRKAIIDQALVVGAIRATLMGWGLPHSLVDPGTWKKASIGTGHASKEEIKAWAIRRFDMSDSLAQDFYDACGIVAYGKQAFA